jgi:steroid delta-isomerase-like uncharacterized protein
MRRRAFILAALVLAAGLSFAAQQSQKPGGEVIKQALAAWSSHDPDKLVGFYTADVVYEDVAYGVVNHGSAELRKFAADFFEAVPDLRLEPVNITIHEGRGAVEWVLTGTDKGLYKTGKKFSVRGASVFEMRGGKCSSNKDFYDLATVMKQVGVLPTQSE